MAKALQRLNLTFHNRAEVGTASELTPSDGLAATHNGQRRCRFVDALLIKIVSSEAVKAAGYTTKNPRQRARELKRDIVRFRRVHLVGASA